MCMPKVKVPEQKAPPPPAAPPPPPPVLEQAAPAQAKKEGEQLDKKAVGTKKFRTSGLGISNSAPTPARSGLGISL